MIEQFATQMRDAGLSETAIRAFSYYYNQVKTGVTGQLAEPGIVPPSTEHIVHFNALHNASSTNLHKMAVIKLNGGLGTSMGLTRCKSLLPVKDGYNFLDIIAGQVLHLRKTTGAAIPLLFMHSFSTRHDSLSYLSRYSDLALADMPLDFVQNKFPRLQQETLTPLNNADDDKNWNPPGHGEIYMVLAQSGVLDALLERGVEYAFLSNSDNLGATVEPRILNYLLDAKLPFLMEVCNRTEMDKKGGHLAEDSSGNLLLRESAQCPPDEVEQFQDINRYRYFNTNNLWVHLPTLKAKLVANDSFLPLSLIKNPKVVDGVPVYQLESAMGAAISLFEGSQALVVHRDRFLPVKKTNDLLGLWSDAYTLHPDWTLRLIETRSKGPVIALDETYFKTIDQLQSHTQQGLPSLKACTSLVVRGDISFGNNLTFVDDVIVESSQPFVLENEVISGIYKR